jgi:hypothetical protein
MLPAAISFTVIFFLDSAQVIKYFLNQQCNDFIEISLRLSLHAYHRQIILIEISPSFISLSYHIFLFGDRNILIEMSLWSFYPQD